MARMQPFVRRFQKKATIMTTVAPSQVGAALEALERSTEQRLHKDAGYSFSALRLNTLRRAYSRHALAPALTNFVRG